MDKAKTKLRTYNNSWYQPGGNILSRVLWYFVNAVYFKSSFPFYAPKRFWLRLFGAKVGRNVIIKPHVNIKYPWNIEIGNDVWIGEQVWIDNLGKVTLCSNSCISQGAMLLCGNHNYKKSSFDLMVKDIVLQEGAWAGARSVVCPGVTLGAHSLLSVGSVAVSNLDPYWVYQGNPAVKVKQRVIE